ncbi:MAG: aminopeptidase P family protein [Chitinophagales bacterium]
MFSTNTYIERRQKLAEQIESGIIVLLGNEEAGMNYTDNTYHFRQDSTFLYYFGINKAGLVGMIDIDGGTATLFGDEMTVDDIVWMGNQPSLKETAAKVGVNYVAPRNQIVEVLQKAQSGGGRAIHYLPPYRAKNTLKLHEWLQIPVKEITDKKSIPLIEAVVNQRLVKSEEEIAEIEKALNVTADLHTTVMEVTQAGVLEREIVGAIQGIALREGGQMAYPIILTVNGQTLHNHYHGNKLEKGQLVLGDFGVELESSYASDITRTFPVDTHFTDQQKAIYQIVLDAQMAAIEAIRPRISFKEIHLLAMEVIAEGLKALGLMKGNVDEAVEAGAVALFMPHGLGHAIGLDVHDMEDLGENLVGYDDTVQRSTKFGYSSLRFGKKLQQGHVITVEPGIYFIPELIDQWQKEGRHADYIHYAALENYRNFGGIRIEDNVLVTATGRKVLGKPIPKTIEEIEALRNSD